MASLKSLRDKARLVQELSFADWLVLVEAWMLLFFFHLILHWVSYERAMISTHLISEKSSDISHTLVFTGQLQRLVGFAARLHLIPMTCLVKSLALQKILNRRNIPVQVKIGVQKIQGAIYAHAWVEADGIPVGEAEDILRRFHVLESASKINNHQFI